MKEFDQLQKTRIDKPFADEGEALKTGINGWSKLVMDGYGFEGDSDFQKEQFDIEFGQTEGQTKKILVYSFLGKIVASIGFVENESLLEKARTFNVHGIVVSPVLKGFGVGSALYENAINEFDVEILVGKTKNPSAVVARANGAARMGMRTFYGEYEVTPNLFGKSDYGSFLANKYLEQRKTYIKGDGLIVLTDITILPPNIPDVTLFPKEIAKAFTPIIEQQKKLGDKDTATLPLISIKKIGK